MERRTRWALWALGAAAAGLTVRGILRAQRRIDFNGRVVLITGGSRGLGLALAREFASEGAHVALLARDGEELERAADELRGGGTQVMTIVGDVGLRADARRAVREVFDRFGQIDVLVNCAGIMEVGPQETMRYADFRRHMRIHAWGPLYLMRSAARMMRRSGGGRIVNIISIGGKLAVPHMAPYTMSKFAAAGLSDALRAEFARHNIRVTSVFPGLMRTGSHVQAGFRGRPEREYAWFAASAGNPLASVSAASAARKIVDACRYGQGQLVISPQAKALVAAQALAPNLVAELMSFVARLLPRPAPLGLNEERLGWDTRSGRVLSALTKPADRAIAMNNQRPAGERMRDEG